MKLKEKEKSSLKERTENKISSFAGIWKMSDKEAEDLMRDIRKGWKRRASKLEEVE